MHLRCSSRAHHVASWRRRSGPVGESPNCPVHEWPHAPEVPIVVLLAVAIREEARLKSLQRCLRSLASQTAPARVYVAWHATNQMLRAATRETLNWFIENCTVKPCLIESASPKTCAQQDSKTALEVPQLLPTH